MEIDADTKITGILGHPIHHSLSPLMHNTVFKHLGLNYVYLPFDVKPEDLKCAINAIRCMNIVGVNLTIPHKEKVIAHLDRIDTEAELIGAVNTIENIDSELVGFNTDGQGFLESLKNDLGFSPKGKSILIVGAGGAARGILVSLALGGAPKISVTNRTYNRAEKLIEEFSDRFPSVKFSALPLDNNTLKNCLGDTDLLINTTSVGMNGDSLRLPLSYLPKSAIIYDIVYNPLKTPLLREAEEAGLTAHNGLGMLVFQGALSFKIWTDVDAPVKLMKETLAKRLFL
ncbi:MAG: shikimate dehydrogenase [Deltaproteobacteria bacterium]|jgi:shikimate dehydrogenase|nr:MAG: shikimate dehydrogenase [Deltaproteobacteria bacterium]